MPFTLMRYKDGKEMPIKVSILDAFRSAPPRKSKAAKPVQMEVKKVNGGFLFPQALLFRFVSNLNVRFSLDEERARSPVITTYSYKLDAHHEIH